MNSPNNDGSGRLNILHPIPPHDVAWKGLVTAGGAA